MSVQYDKKTGAITIAGFDQGISPSPHKGIANMQNVNIATESGEVMCSFSRISEFQKIIPFNTSLSSLANNALQYTFGTNPQLQLGTPILINSSSVTNLNTNQWYFVVGISNFGSYQAISLSTTYNGGAESDFGVSGSALFQTVPVGIPVESAIEKYTDSSGVTQYRYYILDNTATVWYTDTANSTGYSIVWTPIWPPSASITNASGISVINGWLFIFQGTNIFCQSTVILKQISSGWTAFTSQGMNNSYAPHFAYVGHQGKLYYCDGTFIGSIFPNIGANATYTGGINIQSFCAYTGSGTTGTVTNLINGSLPTVATGTIRIPAVFFTSSGGTIPSALSLNTLYWIAYSLSNSNFQVFSAATGGSALNLQTGAVGTQYFNTFYPIGSAGNSSIQYTAQRLNLPNFETATSIVEIGNSIIVGSKTNTLYPWNQVDPTPDSIIELPETNTHYMIAVNNMAYIFAGNKGNIYITNGSVASAVVSVPDYCAGISGTASTYIEPYFTWGGADYIRGRVYFSIQDQTSAKEGNCGGVWSFVPTQNFFSGQDVGLSLRMENQNSYGTYDGLANVIVGNQNQSAVGVQYFSAWTSNTSSPVYGIDGSGTYPNTTAIVESDGIPTGSMLDKKTFERIEYKVASPLLSGESITLNYRKDMTSAWTSCGTVISDSALSGYCVSNFEFTQWLQIQVILTPNGTSTYSGNRLVDIKIS